MIADRVVSIQKEDAIQSRTRHDHGPETSMLANILFLRHSWTPARILDTTAPSFLLLWVVFLPTRKRSTPHLADGGQSHMTASWRTSLTFRSIMLGKGDALSGCQAVWWKHLRLLRCPVISPPRSARTDSPHRDTCSN